MSYMQDILRSIRANAPMTERDIVERELNDWFKSPTFRLMRDGLRYYRLDHDILHHERMVIGPDGKPEPARNVSNNHLVHGFLAELCDQKIQYLLGKEYSFKSDNEADIDKLDELLGPDFRPLLAAVAQDAINMGIAWLHVYYDEEGKWSMKRMRPDEMIPLWRDSNHTQLDAMIRCYEVETYRARQKERVKKVEFWTERGVQYWEYTKGGTLAPDPDRENGPMLRTNDGGLNWQRIPFIACKYNREEQPLIARVKTLVDDYDRIASNDSNTLMDQSNMILVLKDFSGTDLGEARVNISTYRMVKVDDGGGLEAINTPINLEASNMHLERIRRDIYAFGRGVDTRNERIGSATSGVALIHEYAQLDLDCNQLAEGLQAMFDNLLWFIRMDRQNAASPIESEHVTIVFNRDIITSEEGAVDMCRNSVGLISRRTLLANHPWVEDVDEEMERLEEDEERDMERFEMQSALTPKASGVDRLNGATGQNPKAKTPAQRSNANKQRSNAR